MLLNFFISRIIYLDFIATNRYESLISCNTNYLGPEIFLNLKKLLDYNNISHHLLFCNTIPYEKSNPMNIHGVELIFSK